MTDNQGATTVLMKQVTVTATVTYVSDTFARVLASGWGSADTGGAWTLSGAASVFTTDGKVGKIKMASLGSGPAAYLNTASARDEVGTVDVSLDSVPTGGGDYITLAARHAGTSEYRVRVRLQPTLTTLLLTKLVAGTETTLKTVNLTGFTYASGDVLRIKLQTSGSGTATLGAKVWKVGTAEPAAFQATATDTEATLQGAGGVGLGAYLSGSATVAPVTASFDNLTVTNIPAP